MRAALLLLALSFSAHAQTAETILHAGLRAADTVQTCIHLRDPQWHEDFLPWQSCAPIAAYNAGMVGAEILSSHELTHYGHRRLARLDRWAFIAPPAVAIVWSFMHSERRLPAMPPVIPVPVPVAGGQR